MLSMHLPLAGIIMKLSLSSGGCFVSKNAVATGGKVDSSHVYEVAIYP
jgi:hypothetical protein